MVLAFFYCFAALTLCGALATVALRSPVHCAIGLLASLLGVSGIFLQTHAEFLFATQLVVYAGGIILLFLFVIMLVHLDRSRVDRRLARYWPASLIVCVALASELIWLLRKAAFSPLTGTLPGQNTEAIGAILLREYFLPFEIVSLLLLTALAGAVVIARGEA